MGALSTFTALGYPVVVGPSRKSFIGRTLKAEVEDRLAGTLACVVQAWWQGVQVVRVHDVQPTVHLLRMLNAVQAASSAASPLRGEHLTGAIR